MGTHQAAWLALALMVTPLLIRGCDVAMKLPPLAITNFLE
jgi:hypothetical protein